MAAITKNKTPLFEGAYAALKKAILEAEFPPGYQGSEQEIATRLGMSRTPVHEAIIRLQQEGLMEIRPKKGVVISTIAPDDMKQIYDITIALEGMAAELDAALPHEERDILITALTHASSRMERAVESDDLRSWAEADDEFHRQLVDQCQNPRLSRMARTNSDQLHRTRLITLRLRALPKDSAQGHLKIIDAIKSGDAQRAAQSAMEHRRVARDELIPLLKVAGIRHL